MVIDIAFFDTIEQFSLYLDKQLVDTRAQLSTCLKRIETTKNVNPLTSHLSQATKTEKKSLSKNVRQIEVAGFKVLLNPSFDFELNVLDEAANSLQEKLNALEKVKRELLPLLKKNVKIGAIFENEIPVAFMYYAEKL